MCLITKNVRINAQKIYINVYPNTLLVFEYLCNRANIQANRVFVSALLNDMVQVAVVFHRMDLGIFEGRDLSVSQYWISEAEGLGVAAFQKLRGLNIIGI